MKNRQWEQYLRIQVAQEDISLPDAVQERIEQTLDALPSQPLRRKPRVAPMTVSLVACAAVLLLVVMPNLSTAYAATVGEIPIIGELVRVLTIRNYFYDNGRYELTAEIPSVSIPENPAVEERINHDIDALTHSVIQTFYEDVEVNQDEGYGAVTIQYETLTNTEAWFTLRLSIVSSRGSSNTIFKYYHIDRTTGEYVTLGDLFPEAVYPELEEYIVAQMQEQMAQNEAVLYWVGENTAGETFATLHDDQNFYVTDDGTLVIVYDKYEVAPGAMGCPEFAIPYEEYVSWMVPAFAQRFAALTTQTEGD